ncbi:MAG TPA: thiamine pyrophosphate-binding protein [Verrucomicrobiae bacterium]|nr:thiamine pyrophosphate-binding protein [Verrucomicrobiae bacterium]
MAKAQKMEKPRAEWGSDVVVDLLKAFNFEYVSLNPGATFRGLHDSLVNYGGNHAPEIILCNHEEICVALAHGYARAKGRPMAAAVHNIVGLQHASMAIYNAWADRLPVIVLGGTGPMDTANRRPWIDLVHTALVQGNLVRDFVKWDDQPGSVEAVPESFIRAYRLATTEPMGPVYICYDGDVQEKQLDGEVSFPSLDRYPAPLPLQAPEEGFEKTIRWLLDAKKPVILADWVGRKEAGFKALGELAELLGAPVLDQFGRFNFPVEHPLNLTGQADKVVPQADLILALDVPDLEGATVRRVQERGNRRAAPLMAANTKIINVALDDLLVRAWATDFNKLREADLMILADTSVFLPELVRRLKSEKKLADQKSAIDARRADWAKIYEDKKAALEKQRQIKWDEKPVAMTRVYAELAEVLKGEDWVLTNGTSGGKENFYLPAAKFNQILGKYKGGGLGYGLPASLGAGPGAQGLGKTLCRHPARRRPVIYRKRALDRRASSDSAAHYCVQQPVLFQRRGTSGTDRDRPQSRGGEQDHRHPHRGSQRRLRRHGAHLRLLGRRSDHRAQGLDQDAARGGEGGQRRQARAGRRGLPDAVRFF